MLCGRKQQAVFYTTPFFVVQRERETIKVGMLRGRILVKLSISSLGVPADRLMFHMCSILCPFYRLAVVKWVNQTLTKKILAKRTHCSSVCDLSATKPQSSCKAFFEGGRLTIWRSTKLMIIRNHSNKMLSSYFYPSESAPTFLSFNFPTFEVEKPPLLVELFFSMNIMPTAFYDIEFRRTHP